MRRRILVSINLKRSLPIEAESPLLKIPRKDSLNWVIPYDIWANEIIPKYVRYLPALLWNLRLVSKGFRSLCDRLEYWYYIWLTCIPRVYIGPHYYKMVVGAPKLVSPLRMDCSRFDFCPIVASLEDTIVMQLMARLKAETENRVAKNEVQQCKFVCKIKDDKFVLRVKKRSYVVSVFISNMISKTHKV